MCTLLLLGKQSVHVHIADVTLQLLVVETSLLHADRTIQHEVDSISY